MTAHHDTDSDADETVTMSSGFRTLLPYARPAAGRFGLAGALSAAASLLGLVPFWSIYRTVEALVSDDASRADLDRWALIALVAVVGRFALYGSALFVSHLAAYEVLYGIRMGMAEHLTRVPLGEVTRRRSGEVKKVMGDDVERLELFLAHAIPDVMAAAVTLVGAGAWLVWVDWRMGIGALVLVVPAFACMSVAMRRSSPHMAEYQESLAAMNASVVELVRGMPVVRVFNRADDQVRDATDSIGRYVAVVRRYSEGFLPLGTAFFVLVASNVVVLVPLGVWLWSRGSLPTTELLFFFIVGLGVLAPLLALLMFFPRLAYLSSGGDLVREVMDLATLDDAGADGEPSDASVELRDVAFSYGARRVLHDISLRAEPGTITALVGPSGAGKSTIASLVARFWDPDEGTVLVGDVDVRAMTDATLTRHVSVVLQDTFLFDDTVAGNLRVARPEASQAELEAACRAARAHEFVTALPHGYDTPVGEHGARLSGGERQRLTIARAILADTPVVVLDEATAFTDPENEAAIQEAIAGLVADRTVLVIAHRLSTVADADQILVVDDGRIVERGRHDDLVAAGGTYARLWQDFDAASSISLGDAVHAASAGASGDATVVALDAPRSEASDDGLEGEPATRARPTEPTGGLRRGGVMATIWALAGSRRGTLVTSIGWKTAQSVCLAIPVGVLVALIDRLRLDALELDDLRWAMPVLLACLVGQWVFGYLANRSAWIATYELFGRVRVDALDHLRRVPMGFHTSRRAGDTTTALTQDIAALETFTHEPLQQMVGAVVAPFVVFLVLVGQDVAMALATMVSVVAAIPVFVVANRTFKRLATHRQDLQAEAASRMIEYVQGLPVIRAFRLAGERLERFRQALDDYRAVNTALAVKLAPLGMAAMAIVLLGIPFVLWVGTIRYFDGALDAGTFVVFAVLVLRVYQPLLGAAEGIETLRIADASLDRIARVVDEPIQPVPATATASPRDFDVAFDGVSFAYDPTGDLVLHDLAFEVPAGTMTAIVGPSGAGKSTILNLMARFHDVGSGTVRIGDVDVRDLTAEQLFDAVTVVFQDVYLFPGTIFDNIAFGRRDATVAEVEAAARAAQAHEFIAALPDGYDTPVGEAGATLSGGERQRISVARAILKDAPIVLLDEATSAIDPTNERHLQAALAALVRDKTLVVVAHRLSTIASADQILVLDHGRIVEHGDHASLLDGDGLYRRLWDQRARASRWQINADRPTASAGLATADGPP